MMTFSQKMAQRREDRDKLVKQVLLGLFLYVTCVYFGAHFLAAYLLGRWPV